MSHPQVSLDLVQVSPDLGCPKGFRAILGSTPYTALLAEKNPHRSLSNSSSNFLGTQEK